MAPNKSFVFKKIPDGAPKPGVDLVVETREIDLDSAPKGGLLVEVLYASFDPYQRGRMRDASIKSYVSAYPLDQTITNGTVSRVLKSDSPDFKPGDLVIGSLAPIAQYAHIENPKAPAVRKLHNPHNLDLALFLGPLGMPGLTGWSGLHEIGKPKKGETIFVSSAAGAVGQIVGQIAKQKGLTVIGSVGSQEKLDFILNQLGFDAGFNYKTEKPADALKRLAPNGIDIYFENVGGDHLDGALENMNDHGRIPVCGMISGYNDRAGEKKGILNLMNVFIKHLTLRGFIVTDPDFGPAYAQQHQEQVSKWLADGSFKAKLAITNGIDQAPQGFVGMLEGKNFGKAVLKIKGD